MPGIISPMSCDAPHHPASIPPKTDLDLVEDQLVAILRLEDSYVVPHIPCDATIIEDDRLPYEEWRRKICQWSFKVIDHFRLDREVVSCAMNLFDRFLASKPLCNTNKTGGCPCLQCQRKVDSRSFQLTAMSSLYLAIKMYSDNSSDDDLCRPKKLRLMAFAELSRGQFRAKDISDMEMTILNQLKWKVHPPTPMALVSYLLRLVPPHDLVPFSARRSYDLVLHVLHELARYLTELSVCLGSVCSAHSPSQVAYAAILVSMDLLTYEALPGRVRDAYNEAVVTLSYSSGGTILTPHDETILYLQERLRHSFWPEMLIDDCNGAEMGHPISMARDFGLLDISSVSPSSTLAKSQAFAKDIEGSPICVTRPN